jgi:hypothetical protein
MIKKRPMVKQRVRVPSKRSVRSISGDIVAYIRDFDTLNSLRPTVYSIKGKVVDMRK